MRITCSKFIVLYLRVVTGGKDISIGDVDISHPQPLNIYSGISQASGTLLIVSPTLSSAGTSITDVPVTMSGLIFA